jgi:transcription-repair coupling factor (superfamily II helicase)
MNKNLTRLLEKYQKTPKIKQLSALLQPAEVQARIQITGLVGSQPCFILAGAFLNQPKTHLFIATDKEEAAYLQNTLAGVLSPKEILFFPDSFKRPQFFEELNPTNGLQRSETVNKITTSKNSGEIVITYPEALFEKVVKPEELSKTRISINIGEALDVDFMIEVLVEYGFDRVDFVYEPGQFSVRGGIIDVFSYGSESPYRIDLFDTEVESIRTFNPSTQLSELKIASISIVPNINTKFNQSQKVSLLKLLPDNTVIWLNDTQYIKDKLQACFEEAEKFAAKVSALDRSELAEIFRDRAFIYPTDIVTDMATYSLVFMTNMKLVDENIIEKIHFTAQPQPSFNKNFKLLIENLHENSASSVENYIFTDNAKQIERFYSIFEDLGAQIDFHPIDKAIHQGFIDMEAQVACYTDHQIFERYHRYQTRQSYTKDAALSIRTLRELQAGDFVTHIDHGIGVYSGLEKISIGGNMQEAVRLIYLNNDILYVGIQSLHKIAKYVGKEGTPPKLSKIGSDTWKNLKNRTKKQVKDIAEGLIKLYAARRASKGFAASPDGYLQNELEASFMYEDTPDQLSATIAVKSDMEKPYPMDRLVCGDVGFGKTEVAIRAAFKSVVDGKQVAILVPTTILALQHHRTFGERLKEFGATVDYINRFRTAKEKKEVLEKVKSGQVDVLIGTHAILSDQTKFKDLGLLIIDEEQKFGVAAKEKLRNFKVNVDTLTLTATPIPRTLQFSIMSARDLSVIRTPPPNRQPIHTEIRVFSEELIKEAIYNEVQRGGQVFFVHNRVQNLIDIAAMIRKICPDIDIAEAHGQMDPQKLETTLVDFIDKKYDVLVCTNIIETGLDIPNANTIIINNAHQFGLSDLHQLRGRVGRSNKKAHCYLFCPPLSVLTNEARKRLKTIEEFSDLGDGFNIAMRDLDIRGAGNLLGGEQSGFIADIGFETYQKILDEAIQELKENEFKDLFQDDAKKEKTYVKDVQMETDIEMLIPDEYVNSIQERLKLYTELDSLQTEAELDNFSTRLQDRFGKLPPQVSELFEGLRLRWMCKKLGFERIVLKNKKLRCYFVTNPQSKFYETDGFKRIVSFVTLRGEKHQLSFKKSNEHFILIRENVATLQGAKRILEMVGTM